MEEVIIPASNQKIEVLLPVHVVLYFLTEPPILDMYWIPHIVECIEEECGPQVVKLE